MTTASYLGSTLGRFSDQLPKEALVALFIADPDRSLECPAEVLQRLFGLTPREAEMLGCLVGGDTLKQVSDKLGIGMETARSHLKNVFMKTGTSRQGDLVRLVMSTPTCCRHDRMLERHERVTFRQLPSLYKYDATDE